MPPAPPQTNSSAGHLALKTSHRPYRAVRDPGKGQYTGHRHATWTTRPNQTTLRYALNSHPQQLVSYQPSHLALHQLDHKHYARTMHPPPPHGMGSLLQRQWCIHCVCTNAASQHAGAHTQVVSMCMQPPHCCSQLQAALAGSAICHTTSRAATTAAAQNCISCSLAS
jgi:hypothetical protein